MKLKYEWTVLFIFCLWIDPGVAAWGFGNDPGKVLLRDVQVLTLKSGQMSTGRRSSPVPQLKCIGGSAQGLFNPQVVQCYNRGWDGVDVQWECKTDMDNLYRFGSVEVVCEGYDYPEDPYITKGSCGLEYTLELTNEGRAQQKNSNSWNSNYNSFKSSYEKSSTGFADFIVFAVIMLIIYALYKTCIDNGDNIGDRAYSSTNNDYPGGAPGGSPGAGGGGGWFNPRQNQNHYQGGYDDAACGANRRQGTGGGGGGFWTGLGTGGLLGYMLGGGNRGYGGYNRGYRQGWTGGGWGG